VSSGLSASDNSNRRFYGAAALRTAQVDRKREPRGWPREYSTGAFPKNHVKVTLQKFVVVIDDLQKSSKMDLRL